MRVLVKGKNEDQIKKNIQQKENNGWVQISPIKKYSISHYADELVCVMERPDDDGHGGKKWGKDPNFHY